MNDIISEEQILRHLGKTNINYRLHVYDCVSSTNDLAKEKFLAEKMVNYVVVVANTQSAGRGRNGRSFLSPEGGIYASFIFSGDRITHKQNFSLFAPCVAVCMAMEKLLFIQPQIKWPNDILLHGKKVCGILTETQMNADARTIIVGIGINYLVDMEALPQDFREIASTLSDYTQKISRNEFIAELIKTLDKMCATYTKKQYLWEYKNRMTILGSDILIVTEIEKIYAKALDVCDDGCLVIEKKDGVTEKIYAGDVSIRVGNKE